MFTTRRRLHAAESRAERLDNYAQSLEAQKREAEELHEAAKRDADERQRWCIAELETQHERAIADERAKYGAELSRVTSELEHRIGELAAAKAAAETCASDERRRASVLLDIASESNTRLIAQLQAERLRIAWTHVEPNRWTIEELNLEATISGSGRWTLIDTRNDRTIIADDYSIIALVANEIAAQRRQTLETRQTVEADAFRSTVQTAVDMRLTEAKAAYSFATPNTNESE